VSAPSAPGLPVLYLEAARPRTLPAAVAPVLVGTAAATTPLAELSAVRFGLALVVALSLQVAVNYANDYFDGVKGVDTEARTGPRRAVASGLITPSGMRTATFAAMAVAGVAGLALAAMAGWELLAVGALALIATLGYSGGDRPYASRGFGEVSVFVFFGLVATAGSAYLQDEALALLPLLASVPVGLVAVALLVVNNLRDIPQDGLAGKRTLAVRLGEARTRRLFQALLIGALGFVGPIALVAGSTWPIIALAATPLAAPAIKVVRNVPLGRGLIPALEITGRFHLLLGVLLSAGLLLADRS
jgi:1,4-dihydroxy-2-naphthoate polyprenyltransferase